MHLSLDFPECPYVMEMTNPTTQNPTIQLTMRCLIIFPVLLMVAQAIPASLSTGCSVAPCFYPPCPTFCPPPGQCRVVPCFHPPCPEICDSGPSRPCGCKCAYCGLGQRCVENSFTGQAKCVPDDIFGQQ